MKKEQIESFLGERIVEPGRGSGKIRTASGRIYFLKSGVLPSAAYRCEANGLGELRKTDAIRVAEPVLAGDDFILTEFIESGRSSDSFFEEFGRQLARMHRHTAASFGFYEDNFIGLNPQSNIPEGNEANDWTAFYFNKRLLFQYRLAEQNGYATERLRKGFSRLESAIAPLLSGSEEPPTLLHGDLWGGNYLCDLQNHAVLIDPAVYYGHREADLAMTKLFGGFSPAFYSAYREEYPLSDGWEYRENIYILYHVMNHLNLFGRGYLAQAERMLEQYTR